MFRQMRRFKQQLSREECLAILTTEKRGVLAVLGDGGYPYAVPLSFACDGERLWFHCAKEGHKLDAIRACEKASFCVLRQGELSEDGWSYYVDSAIAFGTVQVVGDEQKRLAALRLLGDKYFPDEQMTAEDIQKNAHRALVLCLHIEHLSGKHVHER